MPRPVLPGEIGPGPEDTPSTHGGPRGRAQLAPHARRARPRRPGSSGITLVDSTRGGPRGRAQVPHQAPRWVIERQQTLRKLGYGGVVDGVWGPRARAQWNEFLADLKGTGPGVYRPAAAGRHMPKAPIGVRRGMGFLVRQHAFEEKLQEAKERLRSSHAPGGLSQTPVGQFSPRARQVAAQEKVKMLRHQEKWRLARRNPILMRAYFGGKGQLPTGERSVPWGQPFITKDLGAEDVLGLIDRDFQRGTGLFLKPVVYVNEKGKKVGGVQVTPMLEAMLSSWLHQRGAKLPRNPRPDQINKAIMDLVRRKEHAEKVRHVRAVRKAYFDTGLWTRAVVDLGIDRPQDYTMVGGKMVRPRGGTPDLWTPEGAAEAIATGRMGIVPILLKMTEYQERSIIDKNFEAIMAAYVNTGNLLGLSSGGVGNFDISNPFVPESVVKSKNQREFEQRVMVERQKAEQAIKLAMDAFAAKLSQETGEPYHFDLNLLLKTQEMGLAARFPAGDPMGIVHPGPLEHASVNKGWVDSLRHFERPLSEGVTKFLGVSGEVGAQALAVMGVPGTVLHTAYIGVVGTWQSAMVDAGKGAGIQYVKATQKIDGSTGVVVATVPGHFIGIEEAYAHGVIWREELPVWAQLVGDSVLDPLNFVSGSWFVQPIRAFKRWRQGVELVTDVTEFSDDVRKSADLITQGTGTVDRQAGAMRGQLAVKVEALDQVGREVTVANRRGNFEELGLSKTLGQTEALRLAKAKVALELMTAPFTAPVMKHLIRRGVSLYRDVERRDLSPTGYYLLGRMEQWMRGSTRRQIQRTYPQLQLPDTAISGFAHGPVHPEVRDLYDALQEGKRAWIVEQLLPAIQDEIEARAPIIFDSAGRNVPGELVERFEHSLTQILRELVEDQVDVPNHIFGLVFTTREAWATIRAEAKEVVDRAIGQDRLARPDLWLDDSPRGVRYRQQFKRTETERAEHRVATNWLSPGEKWGVADVLDEVQKRKHAAQEEVAMLALAEARQMEIQDAILDVAGEYLLLTYHLSPDEQGEDFLKGLFKWTNTDLIERFLARHPNYTITGPEEELIRRREELSLAVAREHSGLPDPDWIALSVGGKDLAREARVFIKDTAETWEGKNGSVMLDVKMRKTIEHALSIFFEGDLEANGLARGQEAREALERSIDQIISGAVSGSKRRELLQSLRSTVLDSAALVELRTALETLQRQYLREADELEAMHSQGPPIRARVHSAELFPGDRIVAPGSADSPMNLSGRTVREVDPDGTVHFEDGHQWLPKEGEHGELVVDRSGGVPHSEIRQKGRDLADTKRRMHKASNAFFAELWSTAEPALLRQTLESVRDERDAVARMLEGDMRTGWRAATPDPTDGVTGEMIQEAFDLALQEHRAALKALYREMQDPRMESYVGVDSFYTHIQNVLRKGRSPGRMGLEDQELRQKIRAIDDYFARAPGLAAQTVVYRGMPEKFLPEVGSEAVEKGFVSTSTSRDRALSFGGRTMKVILPEGLPFYPRHIDELEVVLPRGLRFRRVDEDTLEVVGGFEATEARQDVSAVADRLRKTVPAAPTRMDVIDFLHQRQADLEAAFAARKAMDESAETDWLSDVPVGTEVTDELVREMHLRRIADLERLAHEAVQNLDHPDFHDLAPDINQVLRSEQPGVFETPIGARTWEVVRQVTGRIDRWFDQEAKGLAEPITVYRVVDILAQPEHDFYEELGYLSVSRTPEGALASAEHVEKPIPPGRQKVQVLHLPKQLGVYAGDLMEGRLLLPRRLKLQRTHDGEWRVTGAFKHKVNRIDPWSLMDGSGAMPEEASTRAALERRVAPQPAVEVPPYDVGRRHLEALHTALGERVKRLEYINDLARSRRGLLTEMRPKTGQYAMRGAIIENLRELNEIAKAQRRALQQEIHYDGIDTQKLIDMADKGAGGWMDVRPEIRMPKHLASHTETRHQNLADVADEADSVAWMMQDPEFQVFPKELDLADEGSSTLTDEARKVSEAGDRVVHAKVPTRVKGPDPDVPVPRVATPVEKRGRLVARRPTPQETAWVLGGPDRPNYGRTAQPEEAQVSTKERFGKMDLPAVASEAGSVRRIADSLRERQGIYKAYSDLHRSQLLKARGLWIAAGKYSDSMAVRGMYRSYMAAAQMWKTWILPGTPGWTVLNFIDGAVKGLVKGIADPRLYLNANGKSFPELFPLATISKVVRLLDSRLGTNVGPKFERWVWAFYNQRKEVLDGLFGTHGITFPKELMDGYAAHSMRVQGDASRPGKIGDWRGRQSAARVMRLQAADLRKRAAAIREKDPHQAWELIARAKQLRRQYVFTMGGAYHDLLWGFFVEIGEGRFRKGAYVKWYREEMAKQKMLNPGAEEIDQQAEANEHAMELVKHTYFSSDSATVAEDNLSVLWPFVTFVKDNTKFWAKEVFRKPALLAVVDHVQEAGPYSEESGDPEAPSWLERYWTTTFMGRLPIFSQLNDTLFRDGKFDPLNLTSLGLLYRSFKAQNEHLTEEQGGLELLNLFSSATSDVGLGMAPWFRKPLEATGLIAPEFWRDVFPQTSMVQAFDAHFFNKRWPDGINLELLVLDPIYQSLLGVDLSKIRRHDFDMLVNREIAGMILRGEGTSEADRREKAEKKVSDALIVRNVWNWFTHVYVRRVTPSDVWFYHQSEKMRDEFKADGGFGDTYNNFSDQQQLAYSVYKRRDRPIGALDRWVADQGLVQHYYNLEPKDREAFFLLHPELIAYVGWRVREFNLNGEPTGAEERYRRRQARKKRNATLAARTDVVMKLGDSMRTEQHDGAYRSLEDQWRDSLVTPELEAFWERNDTPADDRRKMMRLEYQELVDELHRDYFSIPEQDFKAKAAFLKANPLLSDVWRRGGVRLDSTGLPVPGAQADDLRSIVQMFRAHARDYYFMLMDAKGYDAASAFLAQHSDIFVGTKSALHISEPFSDNAVWLPSKRGDELSNKYLEAKPWLDAYFAASDAAEKDGGAEAARLARRAVGDAHPIVYEYFDLKEEWVTSGKLKLSARQIADEKQRVAQLDQHGKDYLKIKKVMKAYFALPEKSQARRDFAAAHPELVAYWKKYSQGGGGRGGFHSHRRRHFARDWVASQGLLDAYFDLAPGKARQAYLAAHPGLSAHVVEASAARSAGADKLHIVRRYNFWMHLLALEPDEQEAYVRAHAAEAGVFVYGIVGAQEIFDNKQSGLAFKFAHGELSRQQAYLMIKPLLDIFFSLPPEQRAFYEQMNPEVTIYMRLYAHHKSLTGNPKTDKLIEAFFDLPSWDVAKKQVYLEEHPEVQKWLSSRGTPEERALGKLIDAYFRVPMEHRPEWLMMHPEVLSFFDVRSAQHDQDRVLAKAFDAIDPRWQAAQWGLYEDKMYAETVRIKLQQARVKPKEITARREREFEERERADTT